MKVMNLVLSKLAVLCTVNTMPSGHGERRDCCPRRCWRVKSFYVFLHDIMHMRLSAGLAHFSLQGYWQI